MLGFFQETEYEAMYTISSLLALSLEDGTSDFTEDAKLWAAKMEVLQCALFTMVKNVTELIIDQTDNTWAKLSHARFLTPCRRAYPTLLI